MSLLSHSVTQINRTSFLVKDTTTQQAYDDAGVDLTSGVTVAVLQITNLYDQTTYDINILADWSYLLGDGITINITDVPGDQISGYDYFPDWMYRFKISYTYNGFAYTKTIESGFNYYIKCAVYQQVQRSDWKIDLGIANKCEKSSTSSRKFSWLNALTMSNELSLLSEYTEIMKALYKLCGYTHEFNS